MSEQPLLTRIAEGDKTAVSQFIDRYGGLVWSLARRFTDNNADAEDAVQEIFVELWKSAKNYRAEIATETTFTAMVARRRLIDRRRRRRADQPADVQFDQLVSDSRSASEEVELSDEAAKASKCLDQLPSDQSRAIKLSVYDGLSHSQIADVTGLSLGTVKTHIRRGLIKLREQIGFTSAIETKGV